MKIDSPVGPLWLAAHGDALAKLHFTPLPDEDSPVLREAARQLAAYFAGRLKVFDLPLSLSGTPFQQQVWKALQGIQFGETRSYGDIARAIGSPSAVRAVGGANHANPVGIIVPCHRVIGSDRKLTGYGGGLDAKRWLLAHEGRGSLDLLGAEPRAQHLDLVADE